MYTQCPDCATVFRVTAEALRVLADPAEYRPLGAAARGMVLEHYGLEVAVPELRDYFQRVADAGRRDRM